MINAHAPAVHIDVPLQQEHYLSKCNVIWRQKQLLVRLFQRFEQPYLPTTRSEWLLSECLKRSSVQLVRLDPSLGEAQIKLWADAAEKADKKVFLQLPSTQLIPQKHSTFSWFLKQLADRLAATVLLLLIAPLMFFITGLICIYSPGPIFFQQWRVGERGKLFKIWKFRTMVVDAEKLHHRVMGDQNGLHKLKDDPRLTPIGAWMRRYSLDELPQLFNVLRGEMSLVGPRPWALYDALRLSPEGKKRLNALPGITGAWQVQARSNLVDMDAVNCIDLEYLRDWSLRQDLKILMMTLPKVFLGFGAY